MNGAGHKVENEEVSCFKSPIMLINVKMPTVVGILTFMNRINLWLAELSMEKVL